MRLDELLAGRVVVPTEIAAITLHGLALDSRTVQAGDLFIARAGQHQHGLTYLAAVVAAGAVAVLYDPEGVTLPPPAPIPLIPLPQLEPQLSALAGRFYGDPSRQLELIGVTGTNGKSSVVHLIATVLDRLRGGCGLMGTLGAGLVGKVVYNGMTTPDAVTVQQQLAAWVAAGVGTGVMEVSSHALAQYRVDAVRYTTAIFTNLTRDHLDYHQTMAAYGAAKARLFQLPELRHAVIQSGDPFGLTLLRHLPEGVAGIGYALVNRGESPPPKSEVIGVPIHYHRDGVELEVATPWGRATLHLPLLGRFNVENSLAALTALLLSGVSLSEVVAQLEQIAPPCGRLEPISVAGAPQVWVDFAHTPDGLRAALEAVRLHHRGRLWVVFGCGGDRDRGKRPLMGAVAEAGADTLILTSDNPRSESPTAIIEEIVAGLRHPEAALVEPDRAAAIQMAISRAAADDWILIAGKGHEQEQILAHGAIPFSDQAVARTALEQRRCH